MTNCYVYSEDKIRRAAERALELYRKGATSGEAIGTADAEFLNCPRDFDEMCVIFYRSIGRM
jgi:hypothetical protein